MPAQAAMLVVFVPGPISLGTINLVTAVATAKASAMQLRLKVPQRRRRLETAGLERVNPASE